MKKIKRFFITLLTGLTVCAVAVGLSACTVQKGEREGNSVSSSDSSVVHTHTFGEWTVEKAATCEQAGSQYRVCACGEKETKTIPATGHNEVQDARVEPTCTKDGKTEGSHCSNCNKVMKESEILPAFGHDEEFENENSKVATCMTKAYCGVCGQEYGDKLAHEPVLVDVQGQEPTCLGGGWTDYVKCMECTYSTKRDLPALGHDGNRSGQSTYISSETRAATCTEKAYCGICKLEYGPEPSHDEALKNANSKVATCTTKAYCGVCGQEYGEALGHDMVWVDAKAATCTEVGWDRYFHCERSGCTECSKVEIPALGHDYAIFVEAKDPTCTEMGYTEGTQCSRCSSMEIIPTAISALGHDGQRAGQYTSDDLLDEHSYLGDCTRSSYCGICNMEYGDIVSGVHTLKTVAAKAPTCSAYGWKEYEICLKCNYSTFEENKLEMIPHTVRYYEGKAATCTEPGYEGGYICIVCEQWKLETIPPLGHDGYREGQTEPALSDTVIGDCETQSYCAICGTYGEEPTGHTPRKEATCTEKAVCANCGQEYGEPLGHCYRNNTCVLCGKRKGEED